jgi:hypothetical protein
MGGQVREVPFRGVAAVAFGSDQQTAGLPKAPFAQLVLSDGGRLSLAAATLDTDAKTVRGQTLFGAEAALPLADLIALEVRQGRAVYLSDLPADRCEHTPFLGVSWPLVKDGSVTGRALRLRTGTHDKGLGMHARSRVSYRLDGKYRYFEALVGLDAQTGKAGRARVEVLLDGKARPLGWDGNLSGRDAPRALRLDVRQAKTLTLVVDFGPQGDVQSHVNWADARLLP